MTTNPEPGLGRRSKEEEVALDEMLASIRSRHEKDRIAGAKELDPTRAPLKSPQSWRMRMTALAAVTLTLVGVGLLLLWLIRESPPSAPPVPWQTTASALGTLIAVSISVSVAIIETGRARSARRDADALRSEQEHRRRREVASQVAGWIEDKYVPNEDGTAYRRDVLIVLANASNEPVFDVNVSTGISWPSRLSLGPLSVPKPLVTLPPGRELRWDISIPILAHEINPAYPLAVELGFTTPNGLRWTRTFEGELVETSGSIARLFDSDNLEGMQAQLGRMDPLNPLAVVMTFVNSLIGESGIDRELFEAVIAPEAEGWRNVTDEQLAEIAAELQLYGIASYVHYPAPHVAYVKIVAQQYERSQVVVGDSLEVEAKFILLTFQWSRGWRVFSYGQDIIPPEQILFPRGELNDANKTIFSVSNELEDP